MDDRRSPRTTAPACPARPLSVSAAQPRAPRPCRIASLSLLQSSCYPFSCLVDPGPLAMVLGGRFHLGDRRSRISPTHLHVHQLHHVRLVLPVTGEAVPGASARVNTEQAQAVGAGHGGAARAEPTERQVA